VAIRTTDTERHEMSEPRPLPRAGEPAPEIDAAITGGGRFLLSANRGKWLVVYFFPRANTPG
jgi:peroxiredoxin Q/BCP